MELVWKSRKCLVSIVGRIKVLYHFLPSLVFPSCCFLLLLWFVLVLIVLNIILFLMITLIFDRIFLLVVLLSIITDVLHLLHLCEWLHLYPLFIQLKCTNSFGQSNFLLVISWVKEKHGLAIWSTSSLYFLWLITHSNHALE